MSTLQNDLDAFKAEFVAKLPKDKAAIMNRADAELEVRPGPARGVARVDVGLRVAGRKPLEGFVLPQLHVRSDGLAGRLSDDRAIGGAVGTDLPRQSRPDLSAHDRRNGTSVDRVLADAGKDVLGSGNEQLIVDPGAISTRTRESHS